MPGLQLVLRRKACVPRGCVSLRRAPRSGVVYLAVLGTALIVAVVSLAAVHVARVELRGVAGLADRLRAQNAARSALEAALAYLAVHPEWRTELKSGADMPAAGWTSLPTGGEFRWQLLEDDHDFSDDDSETLRLRGLGRAGTATYVESVLLEPRGEPLDCLEVSVYSHFHFRIVNAPQTETDQTIAAGADIELVNSTVLGDIETAGTLTGGAPVPGCALVQSAPPRRMPGPSAFDYYRAVGTPIQLSDLPIVGGVRRLGHCALGPGCNPFGPANPQGIYVIDCNSTHINIVNLRVVGTLVLLNSGTEERPSQLAGDVCWEPAARHLPALLVQGWLNLLPNGDHAHLASYNRLNEWTHNSNFNPPGLPYLGQVDNDQSDWYPNGIQGLVYISRASEIIPPGTSTRRWVRINGCLVAAKIFHRHQLTVDYDPIYRYYPPPGFAHGSQVRPIPGSWRREAL